MDHHRLEAVPAPPLGRRRRLLLGLPRHHASDGARLGQPDDLPLLPRHRGGHVWSRSAVIPIV